MNLSEKRKKLREDITYLFDKINWGDSFLDAKAIQIMNEFMKDIYDADREFIKLLLANDTSNKCKCCIEWRKEIKKYAGDDLIK